MTDPNALLAAVRRLSKEAARSEDHIATALAAVFDSLDDTLTKGGTLPDDWSKTLRGKVGP